MNFTHKEQHNLTWPCLFSFLMACLYKASSNISWTHHNATLAVVIYAQYEWDELAYSGQQKKCRDVNSAFFLWIKNYRIKTLMLLTNILRWQQIKLDHFEFWSTGLELRVIRRTISYIMSFSSLYKIGVPKAAALGSKVRFDCVLTGKGSRNS